MQHDPPPANRLVDATSPYLRQHAGNPVHWWSWEDAAFVEARRRNVPVLLSIGYAACHWCHVMAHESFEDPRIAGVMNEAFVNIKVDREERPDVDQLYMAALHALGEPGGWPLTMFLDHDRNAFWGGTYFPPTARYGKPGFGDLCREIARVFAAEPQRVATNVRQLRSHLEQRDFRAAGIGPDLLDQAAGRLLGIMDPVAGGTRGAPKFPQSIVLETLERAGARTGDPAYHAVVDTTLTKLCSGGIYDHVGGGFARYSVDDRWLVPHFEKMLYDNALLLARLTSAWQRSGNPLFRNRIEHSWAFLDREMRLPEGGFASSLDADSEGVEGKFYVWNPEQVVAVLGDAAALETCARYDISAAGNWEHVSIPNRLRDLWSDAETERRFAASLEALRVSRETRVRPARDDKFLTDWNAYLAAALARMAVAFRKDDLAREAETLYRTAYETITVRAAHSTLHGVVGAPAMATDYAAVAAAALALHACTGRPGLLEEAADLLEQLEQEFRDGRSGLYLLAPSTRPDLPLPFLSTADEATPNPNGTAAEALVRLGFLTGEQRWLDRADRLLGSMAGAVRQNVFAHASALNALDLRLHGLQVVVLAGDDPQAAERLVREVGAIPADGWTLVRTARGVSAGSTSPAAGKAAVGNQATAYICRGQTCSPPITDPARLAEALRVRA